MKLLLDTQCWLWWFTQPELLNEAAMSFDFWLSVKPHRHSSISSIVKPISLKICRSNLGEMSRPL
ncbi:hypothetical protein [Nostoc sp.]|uniref:hypothetical protein n=1 Tax=Nostoc sp. TaxID=1180 RepID=UPI002FF7F93D